MVSGLGLGLFGFLPVIKPIFSDEDQKPVFFLGSFRFFSNQLGGFDNIFESFGPENIGYQVTPLVDSRKVSKTVPANRKIVLVEKGCKGRFALRRGYSL